MNLDRIIRVLFFLLAVTVFLWLAMAMPARADECDLGHDSGKPFKAQSVVDNILITMFWFDTLEDLREAIGDPEDETCGYSECEIVEEKNIAYCHIYAVRPRLIDDVWTSTLGHEALHGIWGDYHGE